MTVQQSERVYKSLWHLAIAAIGLYELYNHKSTASKVLSLGLIAFHADAAVCDAVDIPTTPQRFLMRAVAVQTQPDLQPELMKILQTIPTGTSCGAIAAA